MGWSDELAKDTVLPFFYVLMDGIPRLFMSRRFSGFTKAGYTNSYTLNVDLMQPGSLAAVNQRIDPKRAITIGQDMTITLLDDIDDHLAVLFAENLTGAASTWLDPDTALSFDGTTITVNDTTDFSNGQIIYHGLETSQIGTVATATTFTGCTRALYGSRKHYYDTVDFLEQESIVSSNPVYWVGRQATVYMNFIDPNTELPYDSNTGGDYELEIWKGFIREIEIPNPRTFQIRCQELLSALNHKLPARQAQGVIAYKANTQSGYELSELMGKRVYIDDSNNKLRWAWAADADSSLYYPYYETLRDPVDGGDISDGLYTLQDIFYAIHYTIGQYSSDPADPAITDDSIMFFLDEVYESGSDGGSTFSHYTLKIVNNAYAANKYWKLTFGTSYHNYDSENYASIMDYLIPNSVLVSSGGVVTGTLFDAGPVTTMSLGPSTAVFPFLLVDVNEDFQVQYNSLGYALLTDGSQREYVSFTGTTQISEKLYTLDGVTRGLFGTTPKTWSDPETDITLKQVWGFPPENSSGVQMTAFHIMLHMLIASGKTDYNDSTYDKMKYGFGLALQNTHVDIPAFEQMAKAKFHLANRHRGVVLDDPTSVMDYCREELAAMGCWMIARRVGSAYKITVFKIGMPIPSKVQKTITTGWTKKGIAPAIKRGFGELLNQIKFELHYDPDRGQMTPPDYTIRHRAGINMMLGKVVSLTIENKHIRCNPASGLGKAKIIAESYFLMFGRPMKRVIVQVDSLAWEVGVGDSVGFTWPGLPTETGARGWTSKTCLVMRCDDRYTGPNFGATLELALPIQDRWNEYAPAAVIDTVDDGTTLTLIANTYSDASMTALYGLSGTVQDIDPFIREDSKILVYTPRDYANGITATVDASASTRASNTLKVDATAGMAAGDRVVFDVYGTATTQQKSEYAYIGDNSGDTGGDISDMWNA